jgi:putative ABC transport system substrate-binding protein
VWPVTVSTQQSGGAVRIGYLAAGSPENSTRVLEAFRHRLRELGRFEGQDIALDYRFAENDYTQLPPLVAELVESRVPSSWLRRRQLWQPPEARAHNLSHPDAG